MFGNIVERIENVIVQVNEVKVQFVEKDAKVAELEAALESKEAELAEAKAQVEAMQAEMEELKNKVVSEEDMAQLEDVVGRLESAFVEPIE